MYVAAAAAAFAGRGARKNDEWTGNIFPDQERAAYRKPCLPGCERVGYSISWFLKLLEDISFNDPCAN